MISSKIQPQLLPISSTIERLINEVPGWTPPDQLLALYTLAVSTSFLGGDILEVGSWCGRSAVILGLAARSCSPTTVYCIDLFPEEHDWYQNQDRSYSFQVDLGDRAVAGYNVQTVWEEPFLRDIAPVYRNHGSIRSAFEHFVNKYEVAQCVSAHRNDLATFLAGRPSDMRLRLAFIDGDHSYEGVVRDIEAVHSCLIPGGWICFDDAFTSYQGVDDAIKHKILDSGNYEQCVQFSRKLFGARKLK